MSVISYDFDDTLCLWSDHQFNERGLYIASPTPNKKLIKNLLKEHEAGHEIIIVTWRQPPQRYEAQLFCEEHDLPIKAIFCTGGNPKSEVLNEQKAIIHYDDAHYIGFDVIQNCRNCEFILVKNSFSTNTTDNYFPNKFVY